MSKLKGLLLTQGMHGMISQAEGLAKALDIDFTQYLRLLLNLLPGLSCHAYLELIKYLLI